MVSKTGDDLSQIEAVIPNCPSHRTLNFSELTLQKIWQFHLRITMRQQKLYLISTCEYTSFKYSMWWNGKDSLGISAD